jgi:hypothetical protein
MFDVSSAVVIVKLQRTYDLQKKIYPTLHPKSYNSPAQIKQTLYTQPGVSYAQITKQNSYTPAPLEEVPNTIQPHQQNSDMQELKNMIKGLFNQLGTMLNLLTSVLTKLKY